MEQLHLITAVIQKGRAEIVARKVEEAGAQGATWFTGTGSGVRQKIGLIINPEKDIIFIVTRESETRAVYEAVIEAGSLRDKGMGFAFISKVEEALGFLD